MNGWQIIYQRRRKMLTRLAAVLAVGLAGLAAVLPRADAHGPAQVAAIHADAAGSLLLAPERLSGKRFAALYAPGASLASGD